MMVQMQMRTFWESVKFTVLVSVSVCRSLLV